MRHRHVPWLVQRVSVLILAAGLVMLLTASWAMAQIGGTIGYGSSVFGSVAAAGQTLTFSFSGSAGDLVQASLRNWTGTFDPRLDLVAPDGQTAAQSGNHPLSENPLEAFISFFLPQTGIYSLRVSGAGDTTGEFVLKLAGRGGLTPTTLVFGQSVDVNVPVNPAPQIYSFEAQDCPTVLTISNLSDGLPFTFPYFIRVHNKQGTEIAHLYGGDALEDRLTLAPLSGRYEVTVSSNDPEAQGIVQLLVTCLDEAPGCLAGVPGHGLSTGTCPPCFETGEACDFFEVSVTREGGTATFTWPPVEGADWYIFSVVDSAGDLLIDSAQILEGETSHTYVFNPADLPRGPFTAFVSAGAEGGDSDPLCIDDVEVRFDGMTTDECSGLVLGADVVPGGPRAVVLHWTPVPGAAAYLIHVYAVGEDGGLIGIRVLTIPGDAATYHLSDVFPDEYENFQIRVAAYSEADGGGAFGDMPQGYLCDGVANVTFGPLGPVHWGPAS
ncbi:MAG: PPC domain-containing protein [Chloroflexi bacterium]|nr:PPC domain-containing protein [Chloroflexota bacterium]